MAYAAANGEFKTPDDISNFINSSFVFKQIYDKDGNQKDTTTLDFGEYNNQKYGSVKNKMGGRPYAILKDGTGMAITFQYKDNKLDVAYVIDTKYDHDKYGTDAFNVIFAPMVRVPANTEDNYLFVVTTKGYVFPANESEQPCLNAIFDRGWNVNPSLFKSGGACNYSID